jgi:hypothetical protein
MAQAVQVMGSLAITGAVKLSGYFKQLYRLDVRAVVSDEEKWWRPPRRRSRHCPLLTPCLAVHP